MLKKQFGFFLIVGFVALHLAGSASAANSVNITLTATTETMTDVGGGELQFTTQKVRITNKDIVTRLGKVYSLPLAGAVLSFAVPGGFQLLDLHGNFLYSVDSGVLRIENGPLMARSGTYNPNPGQITKLRSLYTLEWIFDVDTEDHFTLSGPSDQNTFQDLATGFSRFLLNMNLAGIGKLNDQNCVIIGKIKIKAQSTP